MHVPDMLAEWTPKWQLMAWGHPMPSSCFWLLNSDLNMRAFVWEVWLNIHVNGIFMLMWQLWDVFIINHVIMILDSSGDRTQDISVLQWMLSVYTIWAVVVVQNISGLGWKCVIHLSYENMDTGNKNMSYFLSHVWVCTSFHVLVFSYKKITEPFSGPITTAFFFSVQFWFSFKMVANITVQFNFGSTKK